MLQEKHLALETVLLSMPLDCRDFLQQIEVSIFSISKS